VQDSKDLLSVFNELKSDQIKYNQVCESNKKFVETRKGATKIIVDYLKINGIS
jgi:hypothetical protein